MAKADEQKDFDPTVNSPLVNALRLYKHVLMKGFQAGGVVGVAAVGPVVAYRHYSRTGSLAGAGPPVVNALAKTAITLIGIAGAMGIAKIYGYDDRKAALEDRVYRLHYSASQNRADLFANIGATAGGLAGATLLGPAALAVLGSAAAGSAAGIIAHVATAKSKK